MSSILDIFGVHTITLHYPGGQGAYGPTPGKDETISGVFVTETTRMVRDKTGTEVVSTATITAPPNLPVPENTEVTLPSGRRRRVLSVANNTSGPLDLPDNTLIHVD